MIIWKKICVIQRLYIIFILWSIQDSLACAVADEMQKIYRHELGPQPIPFMVPGEVVDEEDVSISFT